MKKTIRLTRHIRHTNHSGVRDTGVIDYMDFEYMADYCLTAVQMKDDEGLFITPSIDAFPSALAYENRLVQENSSASPPDCVQASAFKVITSIHDKNSNPLKTSLVLPSTKTSR